MKTNDPVEMVSVKELSALTGYAPSTICKRLEPLNSRRKAEIGEKGRLYMTYPKADSLRLLGKRKSTAVLNHEADVSLIGDGFQELSKRIESLRIQIENGFGALSQALFELSRAGQSPQEEVKHDPV